MGEPGISEEKNWAIAAYALYLVAPFTTGLTTLIGVVLAHIRRDGARGGVYESHYRNLILVFWVWLAVVFVAAALILTGLAGILVPLLQSWPDHIFRFYRNLQLLGAVFLGVVIACLWYYWRLGRGFVHLLDNRPY